MMRNLRLLFALGAVSIVGIVEAHAQTAFKRVEDWSSVQALMATLNANGTCKISQLATGMSKGIKSLRQIGCSNSAGTNASGRNGIYVEVNSYSKGDLQPNRQNTNLALSSIEIQIPSNLYNNVDRQKIEESVASILTPFGSRKAPLVTSGLNSGQGGELIFPDGSFTKWGFLSRAYGSVYGSPQTFALIIIFHCGTFERPYRYCQMGNQ